MVRIIYRIKNLLQHFTTIVLLHIEYEFKVSTFTNVLNSYLTCHLSTSWRNLAVCWGKGFAKELMQSMFLIYFVILIQFRWKMWKTAIDNISKFHTN